MNVITSASGHVAVVALHGELDLASADRVRALLHQACADRALVVVDMSQVTFIDSSIMGVFVGANKRCVASGGMLRLAHLQPLPARVVSLVGLDSFVISDDAEAPFAAYFRSLAVAGSGSRPREPEAQLSAAPRAQGSPSTGTHAELQADYGCTSRAR